ncbi:hypothetical protein B0H13DRAFT_1945259 [Mycena leptocephala]|nr:hypothetical protein B0H13DRAFT_1945259 [Mycena leptocephala]
MTSERPSPLPAPQPTNMGVDDVAVSTQRGSAVRHLAILGTGLLGIAFLPYMITRRQVATLRRRIDEMGATTTLLRQRQAALGLVTPGAESGATATSVLAQMRQELVAMREQLEQKDSERAKSLSDMTMDVIHINEALDEIRDSVSTLEAANDESGPRLEILDGDLHGLRVGTESGWAEVQEQIRQLRGDQDALRSELFKLSDEVQSAKTAPQNSELQRLLLETKQTRYGISTVRLPKVSLFPSRAIFGSIGTSLGDIATIIHQVQIEMGHERSGGYDPVERLRVLALQMQDQTIHDEKVKSYERGRGRAS